MMAAWEVGETVAYSPDYVKAKFAAARLFKVFDFVEIDDDIVLLIK